MLFVRVYNIFVIYDISYIHFFADAYTYLLYYEHIYRYFTTLIYIGIVHNNTRPFTNIYIYTYIQGDRERERERERESTREMYIDHSVYHAVRMTALINENNGYVLYQYNND